jgi:RNA polymerase sigma factor (sigma-70 family)
MSPLVSAHWKETELTALVHVVDDDASFRTAISRLLRAAGYEVVVYESAQQLLDHLPTENRLGCILLDVQIPGLSGPDLQEQLTKLGSALPIVFLTGHGDIPTSVRAIKGGAEDFLTKPVPKDKLFDAIERSLARYETDRVRDEQLSILRALVATLTRRERQVFELVVRGRMNKQIAHELGTAERTVKAHRQRVMTKMRAQSLAEIVAIAERLGMLAEPTHTQQQSAGKEPQA